MNNINQFIQNKGLEAIKNLQTTMQAHKTEFPKNAPALEQARNEQSTKLKDFLASETKAFFKEAFKFGNPVNSAIQLTSSIANLSKIKKPEVFTNSYTSFKTNDQPTFGKVAAFFQKINIFGHAEAKPLNFENLTDKQLGKLTASQLHSLPNETIQKIDVTKVNANQLNIFLYNGGIDKISNEQAKKLLDTQKPLDESGKALNDVEYQQYTGKTSFHPLQGKLEGNNQIELENKLGV